jgi:hypothetical protein
MKKIFENLKIEKPIFSNNTIVLIAKNDKLLEKIDEFYWSINSKTPDISFSDSEVHIVGNIITLNYENHKFPPFKQFYLMGRISNMPVRFTFEEVETLLEYEAHFNHGWTDEKGLALDLSLNPFGNIKMEKIPKHILDSDMKNLPINRKIDELKIYRDKIVGKIVVEYDSKRISLDVDKVRPVFFEIRNDETRISRIHNFKTTEEKNKLIIDFEIKSIINLKENTYYSFGIKYENLEENYSLLVYEVTQKVFENIHPYSKNELLFNNNILTVGWFDKEGIFFRRTQTKDLFKKYSLNFEKEYKFKQIDRAGKNELEQQYNMFKIDWTKKSSYHNFKG